MCDNAKECDAAKKHGWGTPPARLEGRAWPARTGVVRELSRPAWDHDEPSASDRAAGYTAPDSDQ